MQYKLHRIPIPLLLALAVAVGATVTIIIQVAILAPVPAVVAPIETPDTAIDSGSATYTISIDVAFGEHAVYPTLAGLGKLRLETNTTGWHYMANDWIVTVVRRSPGDATLTLSGGGKVYVREINATHAFILYDKHNTGVVIKKVQVSATGWYVYHPVSTSYDATTRNVITSLMNSLGLSTVYVFQPKSDYVKYDPNTKKFSVYFDSVSSDGSVKLKDLQMDNATSFISISSPVTVNGIERVNTYNYVLYPVWTLLYHKFNADTRTAITISPVS
jgi:hypothetical protein